MSVKVPEFVLSEDHRITTSILDIKIIPAGSFVKPIQYCYLPQHIKDANKWHDPTKQIFCYTSEGIISIPLNIIREIS
jgi:hypothetical protein